MNRPDSAWSRDSMSLAIFQQVDRGSGVWSGLIQAGFGQFSGPNPDWHAIWANFGPQNWTKTRQFWSIFGPGLSQPWPGLAQGVSVLVRFDSNLAQIFGRFWEV